MNFIKKNKIFYAAPIALSSLLLSQSYADDIKKTDDSLDKLEVIDVFGINSSGRDNVYDKNISTNYKNKDDLEKFGSISPSDIFIGFVGVNNGDSRNSGAIDPNIRGIQGQGRVPVSIDGTEQAITVYRGYNGANNRSYIDPLLISSVKVEKGPSMTRGVNSSVGGAVVVRTLNVDDVLQESEKFNIDIRGEIANGSVQENAPDLSNYIGKNANDFGTMFKPTPTSILMDPGLTKLVAVEPRNRGGFFNGKDMAGRIAAAYRTEKFEILGAYAVRERGNYFAGKKGLEDYRFSSAGGGYIPDGDYYARLGEVFNAGQEVPNASISTKSALLKVSLTPLPDHKFNMGLRTTDSNYGDIMPSRISNVRVSLVDEDGWLPQYPLSHTKQRAYNLDYNWNPKDNKWIDLQSSIWATKSETLSYNNIGDLLSAGEFLSERRTGRLHQELIEALQKTHPQCVDVPNGNLNDNVSGCWAAANQISRNLDLFNKLLEGNARVTHFNNRKGFRISNKMQMLGNLAVTIGADLQKETLRPDADVNDVISEVGGFSHAYAKQRFANRKEWNANVRLDYDPTDWLSVSVGGKYSKYDAEDERRNAEIRARKTQSIKKEITGVKLTAVGCDPNDPKQNCEASLALDPNSPAASWPGLPSNACTDPMWSMMLPLGSCIASTGFTWKKRSDGKFHDEDNPYLNGDWERFGWTRPAGGNFNPAFGNSAPITKIYKNTLLGNGYQETTMKGSGFAPSITVSVKPTDKSRVYASYTQTYRMPSIFEATTGFSSSPGSEFFNYDLKPEKASNFEIGYVHNLQSYIPNAEVADIKISYYHNTIKNVLDRHWGLTDFDDIGVRNWDKKMVSGLELQGRYDSGSFFADLGVSYTLKDKICDKELTQTLSPYHKMSECIDQGFEFGYLANMAQPKMMTSLTLGKRFYDRKLEIGTRLTYHSSKRAPAAGGYLNSNSWNPPLSWKSATTIDAYASYQVNKDLKFEFSGSNLTDRFYLDPLSRSVMPAPGRTFRLGMNLKL